MCGIFGQLAIGEGTLPGLAGQASLNRIRHRGPDDEGSWSNDRVYLGIRRLSIIDLKTGHQPIWNEDNSCCIVFNGELYNFRELRPELETRGHQFRSQSDTEVILHAYEQWGAECLRRFNGMFAFAIWDSRRETLFLARDRIGEKPLYYLRNDGHLTFGSEIKAILADPSVRRDFNPRGLANYLAFGHSVAPETMFRGVAKLLPGHYLVGDQTGITIHQYWDVGDEAPPARGVVSEKDYAIRIREVLDDSVRLRMIADVPIGAFLSGGVDSSAVVALMKRHATGPVKTFSLGFTIGGAYNELSDARRVAEHLETEHHELRVEHVDMVDTLRTLVYHYDEPFGDAANFPLYLLSRFAREHVKVVLGGDGGDELFGGYRRYAADRVAQHYQALPSVLTRAVIPAVVEMLPRTRRLKRIVQSLPISDPARRYASWLYVFTPEMQAELLSAECSRQIGDHDVASPYLNYYPVLNGRTSSDHLNRLMYVDLKTWLVDAYMEKTDKASMAASLELRLPMLDPRLVELAFQIPGGMKINGHGLKHILKRAVRDLVPNFVLRKPKHGFAVPTDPWFRGELRSFTAEILLDARTKRRGFFDPVVVERLLSEHTQGRRVWDTHLWLLINFELWNRIYLDREGI